MSNKDWFVSRAEWQVRVEVPLHQDHLSIMVIMMMIILDDDDDDYDDHAGDDGEL